MPRSSAAKRRLSPVSTSSFAEDGGGTESESLPESLETELELDDVGAHSRALDHDHDHEPAFIDEERYPELEPEHQQALRTELQDRLGAYLSQGRARVVITDNIRTMLSIKRARVDGGRRAPHQVYTFRLHHMFIDAPPLVLRSVVAYAERQDPEAAATLRVFIDANEDAIRERDEPRTLTIETAGRYHDLQHIFDALNRDYFAGAIKARITWGPRTKRKPGRSSIKLGSYTVEDELIRIHPVLDAPDVPRYYLAWVVYHEMLHEIHDMPVVDGRRVYHTRAFRQAEAKFEQYPEAVLWERKHLSDLLNR